MVRRGTIRLAAALGTLSVPLSALAQVTGTGSVTTSPLSPAPALGMPLLLFLAVALAGVTMYRLRRVVTGPIVGLVLVAAVTALAGLGYALSMTTTIPISGADCMKRTTNAFNPAGSPANLMSNCSNMIQILDLQVSCIVAPRGTCPDAPADPAPDCRLGQTLANGDVCRLPSCIC